MAVIEVDNLTRRYGSRRGIDSVTLSIGEGALYGFLGPNGAGKTTTIRVLLGFMKATSGAARVLGLDCWSQSDRVKASVGAIPGDLRLWNWLTGRSALNLFSQIRGIDMRPSGARLAEELELDLSVKVRAMSRGMRQKLGLILALAHDPKVLILDEPTTALDPLMQERLLAILRRRAADGRTVFFSSHTLGEVQTLCDRVAIVRAGRIVADSTLDDLRKQAGHEVFIEWPDDADGRRNAAAPPPVGLTLELQSSRKWQGRFAGNLAELLAFVAAKPVHDIRIARPDLESLFRRYYTQDTQESPK
ncbi:MAG: ABC transporter ATP-binding protein [Phycisphaerales bacterium]